MNDRRTYESPTVTKLGSLQQIVLDCTEPVLSDLQGGQAGTACPPGS